VRTSGKYEVTKAALVSPVLIGGFFFSWGMGEPEKCQAGSRGHTMN